MRAWQIETDGGIDALKLATRDTGDPGPGQVKIRCRASSINFRDLSTIKDPVSRGFPFPRIPNSDVAGEIVAVGNGVADFAVGDRVASCFFQQWQDGPCTQTAMDSALGGAIDGVLCEDAILSANGIVRVPDHLSFDEAATLPCAALTAWNALAVAGSAKAGDTVLLLGTGGVSIFALQFAKIMGLRAIITSSSEEKLARAREMGAWATVNYRQTPDWQNEVLARTGGSGVDLTVEVGGAGTLPRSIQATRVAGTIALIGVLTGGEINPALIMRKSIKLQGIYVGSRRMFQDMTAAISTHQLHPVIDRAVPFEDAKAAYHAMESAGHFGKIIVQI